MPNQERIFEAGGRTYTLRFTQNALYRLEKELARPLFVALKSFGLVEVQAMLWAGLEGARLKRRTAPRDSIERGERRDRDGREHPFTLDEAGEIIDQLGGAAAAMPIIMDAWRAAMPPGSDRADADRGEGDPT
jgi:hypothetical protein